MQSCSPASPRRRRAGHGMAAGQDRISALPDGVREHLLSFLPAHEAVRTSVLARSWRDLWTRTPALRITCWGTAAKFAEFVPRLLRLRRRRPGPPLDSCHFDLDDEGNEDAPTIDDVAAVDGWIHGALRCEVREFRLRFRGSYGEERLYLKPSRWAKVHLSKLELSGVTIEEDLDFSCCPALLDLEIDNSFLILDQISSPSLQRLSITECELCPTDRTRICAPSLVLFKLIVCSDRTPLLQRMPSLVSSSVKLNDGTSDQCEIGSIHRCGTCEICQEYYDGYHNDLTTCILLSGLSEARNLELASHPDVFVIRRDIKCHPTFKNLKTLVLTDWFVADDFSGLIGFLQHSPILEKLTLQLSKVQVQKSSVRTEGSCKPLEASVVSDRLKTVEIKCFEVDAMVIEIMNILASSGVPLEQIIIQSSPISSGCANFKCIGLN